MKKHKTNKKLAMTREAVRTLGVTEMMHVEGGSNGHQGQTVFNTTKYFVTTLPVPAPQTLP